MELVEAYSKEQGLWRTDETPEPRFSETLDLDLGSVEASLAGPRRPQDRVALDDMQPSFRQALAEMVDPDHPLLGNGREDAYDRADAESFPASDIPNPDIPVARGGPNEAEGKEGGAVFTGESHTADDTESFPASDTPQALLASTRVGETRRPAASPRTASLRPGPRAPSPSRWMGRSSLSGTAPP